MNGLVTKSTNFLFEKKKSKIKLLGSIYSTESLSKLKETLDEIDQDKSINKVEIYGNFNSGFLLKDLLIYDKSIQQLMEFYTFLQLITESIEKSSKVFIANLKGKVQGPAMELALSCHGITTENNTNLNFYESNNCLMPLLGTIQRLNRIIGYKETLKLLLLTKTLNKNDAIKLGLATENGNYNLLQKKLNKMNWNQDFTNTFTYYNAKIHSNTKNINPAYKAILSSIYEGSICGYDSSLSIEKKWLVWLIRQKKTMETVKTLCSANPEALNTYKS